ncbi:hypothetical protein AAVH_29718 [Aphelenchoides avenae]|nr:hypothetical protein AAVH_29718 [Aphelenchus avenae]
MLSTVDDSLLTPELPIDISLQLLRQSAGNANGAEEPSIDNDAESVPLKEHGAEGVEAKKPQLLMDDFGSICLLVFLYILQATEVHDKNASILLEVALHSL